MSYCFIILSKLGQSQGHLSLNHIQQTTSTLQTVLSKSHKQHSGRWGCACAELYNRSNQLTVQWIITIVT